MSNAMNYQARQLYAYSSIVCDMPYDSACAFAGVQPLSARRYELKRRYFHSITQSDSCLYDFLPQRHDSEILSRLRRHTVYPIPPLTMTKNIAVFFSMPWLNISNRIHKIALSALYMWCLYWLSEARSCSGRHGLFLVFFCIVFVLLFFKKIFSVVSVAQLVARRTNNGRLRVPSPLTQCVSQCWQVTAWGKLSAVAGHLSFFRAVRTWSLRLSALMDSDLAWVNGKSARQSWCYADAFKRSIKIGQPFTILVFF